MTTIKDRILVIEEYKQWRESQEVEGKPSGLDAWTEHLIAREPIEVLSGIHGMALQWVAAARNGDPRDYEEFFMKTAEVLGIELKEITA